MLNPATKKTAYDNPYFLRLSPLNTSGKLRLFFFHYGGGSASLFRGWIKYLPKEVEIIGIQLPGREARFIETPFYQLPSLVGTLSSIFSNFTDIPYMFFGHSLGAIIAFELSRSLRKANKLLPQHLIVSGAQAPHVPLKRKLIHNLPDDEFIKELASYKGIPDSLINNPDLMNVFTPVIRADFTVSETYTFSAEDPLSCPITAFGGMDDPYVDLEDLEDWKIHTKSEFSQYIFEGDHFFLNKEAFTEVMKTINHIIFNEFVLVDEKEKVKNT